MKTQNDDSNNFTSTFIKHFTCTEGNTEQVRTNTGSEATTKEGIFFNRVRVPSGGLEELSIVGMTACTSLSSLRVTHNQLTLDYDHKHHWTE